MLVWGKNWERENGLTLAHVRMGRKGGGARQKVDEGQNYQIQPVQPSKNAPCITGAFFFGIIQD